MLQQQPGDLRLLCATTTKLWPKAEPKNATQKSFTTKLGKIIAKDSNILTTVDAENALMMQIWIKEIHAFKVRIFLAVMSAAVAEPVMPAAIAI